MDNLTNKSEYIEYLLKNYHSILNDIKQMKIELEHYEFESENDTIEGLTFCGTDFSGVGGNSNEIKDDTARVAMVYRNVNKRMNADSKKRLERRIMSGEIELKKLRTAIDCLPEDTKNVIEDLYLKRMKWEQIAMRRYISNNTINRHRKKGIEEITRCFFVGEIVA